MTIESPEKIATAVILPCYNEFETLSKQLTELKFFFDSELLVIVADDSGESQRERVRHAVTQGLGNSKITLAYLFSEKKNGRGAAVRRGMEYVFFNYPQVDFFIECDADGSHLAKDIYNISQKRTFEFVIGSRYMKGSTIVGWPLSRRIFSRILNMTIPLIFRLNCTDITNGLRGYSRKSISLILNHKPLTTGFIFLAEEALVITRSNVAIHEEPIEFHNRTHGETTVGFSEIRDSIKGLIKLLKAY